MDGVSVVVLSLVSCTWSTDWGGVREPSGVASVTFALTGVIDGWVASGAFIVVDGAPVVVVDVVVVVVAASVMVVGDAVVLSFAAALSMSVVSLSVVLSSAAGADVAGPVSPASVAGVSSAVTFSRHKEDTKAKSTTLKATMLRIPSWLV